MVYVNLLSWCQFLIMFFVVVKQCWGPHVCTPTAGCYNGTLMSTVRSFKLFGAFLGIPYAQIPRRFEPPVLYKSTKEHDARKPKLDCLQKNYLVPSRPVGGSENCLYLNIYRNEDVEGLLPVMFYIFGGGFFAGSANPIFTGPEYIMDTGKVILVTIHYRLGAFGFLATSDGVIPGNLGLKDQLCALQWVQENIEYFGGDKNNITVFGQSAGAVSAHMHVLSPLSRDLFHGVIAMSGTANVPFAIDENPDETARKTAKYCKIKNWDKISTQKLLEELKKIPAMDLLNAGDHLKYWDVDNMVNYRPIVEKPSPTAFLSKHPVEILRTGDYKPVPIMFGRVPGEGGVRVIAIMESDKLRTEFNKDFYNLMVKFLEFPKKFNSTQIEKKMQDILDEYFVGERELTNITRQGFMDLVTDRGFYHPLYNAIKMYVHTVDTEKFPVFMYKFDFEGLYTFANLYAGKKTSIDYGVVHCDDLIYMFRSPFLFPDFKKRTVDVRALKLFVNDFVHFAYEKKPKIAVDLKPCNRNTFDSRPGEICDYEVYNKTKRRKVEVHVDNRFDTRRMSFWDSILEENYD